METEGPNARLKQYARCAGRSSASSAIRSWPMNPRQIFGWLSVLAVCLAPCEALAQSALSGDHLAIKRAAGHITIDGDLSDEGWHGATRIEKWYEVQPGDNIEPPVKNVGYLTYDDRFFYAAFEFDDPNVVRDARAVFGSRQSRRRLCRLRRRDSSTAATAAGPATLFLVTPRNIQYDAVLDDASGEDPSPDFFWDSATRITDHGWTLEMRIPFSSLRYRNGSIRRRGASSCIATIPRDRHYQFFSAKLPRGGNCFICRVERARRASRSCRPAAIWSSRRTPARASNAQPRDDARVAARERSRQAARRRRREVHAERRQRDRLHGQAGLLAGRVRHGADLGQRALRVVLSREAAVLPRRRRSVPDADSGGLHAHDHRARLGRPGHRQGARRPVHRRSWPTTTAAAASILPGPNGSDLATQDFGSTGRSIARVKREIGLSFVGMLVHRAAKRWDRRPTPQPRGRSGFPVAAVRHRRRDRASGSTATTRTPDRPDLADEWNGQHLSGHAADRAVGTQHDAS